MQIYYAILRVLYLVFTVVLSCFVGISVVKERKLSTKIVGGLLLVLFIMRIFSIR